MSAASLLKLTEFKTAIDTTVTSLHYLIANIIAVAPDSGIQDMVKEMPNIKAAARISPDGLETLWNKVSCESYDHLITYR